MHILILILCALVSVSAINTKYIQPQKPKYVGKSIACRVIETRKQLHMREQLRNKNKKLEPLIIPEAKKCV